MVSKEFSIKIKVKTTAGMRASTFANTMRFLEEVLFLEIVHKDEDKEFAWFKLPSGEILEVFGPKKIWHPFTTPPEWEVVIADVRHKIESGNASGKSDQLDGMKP